MKFRRGAGLGSLPVGMSASARGRLAGLLRDRIGSAVAALTPPTRFTRPSRLSIPRTRWAPRASPGFFHDDALGVSRVAAAPSMLTRGYFAGRAQVRNADGQDFAQMRAGVKLHKAIMAAIAHPSMAHRFDGTGVAILEVRMARDFKLAHVRWTVHDDGDSRAAAHALRRNAAALKTMAGKMLGSKHTPRLEFIEDGAASRIEAELAEAFELAEARRLVTEAHVERLARRERETMRMKAAGSYRPGAYEHLLDDERTAGDGLGSSEWRAPGERDEEFEALLEEVMANVDDDVDEADDDWSEEVDADDDDDERAGADTWVKPRE